MVKRNVFSIVLLIFRWRDRKWYGHYVVGWWKRMTRNVEALWNYPEIIGSRRVWCILFLFSMPFQINFVWTHFGSFRQCIFSHSVSSLQVSYTSMWGCGWFILCTYMHRFIRPLLVSSNCILIDTSFVSAPSNLPRVLDKVVLFWVS